MFFVSIWLFKWSGERNGGKEGEGVFFSFHLERRVLKRVSRAWFCFFLNVDARMSSFLIGKNVEIFVYEFLFLFSFLTK